MTTWTITRITDSHTYGTVEAETERGARTVAAKRFNDSYAYLMATPAPTADDEVIVLSGRFGTDEPECCDGTGWTGNHRAPCADHYEPLDSIWFS